MKTFIALAATFLFASSAASAQNLNPTYEYGCQTPDDYTSLRLYVGHQDVPQQPGRYTFAFTVRKLDTSVFPAQTVYPGTSVLFHTIGNMTAPTPFAGRLLCLNRQFAAPMGWTRNEDLFQNPVYITPIEQGVLQSAPVSFQAWMRAPGGFELSNAVTITL